MALEALVGRLLLQFSEVAHQLRADRLGLRPALLRRCGGGAGGARFRRVQVCQQVEDESRVDAGIAVVIRVVARRVLVALQVIGQRAFEVVALAVPLPPVLVDGAGEAKRFRVR